MPPEVCSLTASFTWIQRFYSGVIVPAVFAGMNALEATNRMPDIGFFIKGNYKDDEKPLSC